MEPQHFSSLDILQVNWKNIGSLKLQPIFLWKQLAPRSIYLQLWNDCDLFYLEIISVLYKLHLINITSRSPRGFESVTCFLIPARDKFGFQSFSYWRLKKLEWKRRLEPKREWSFWIKLLKARSTSWLLRCDPAWNKLNSWKQIWKSM